MIKNNKTIRKIIIETVNKLDIKMATPKYKKKYMMK